MRWVAFNVQSGTIPRWVAQYLTTDLASSLFYQHHTHKTSSNCSSNPTIDSRLSQYMALFLTPFAAISSHYEVTTPYWIIMCSVSHANVQNFLKWLYWRGNNSDKLAIIPSTVALISADLGSFSLLRFERELKDLFSVFFIFFIASRKLRKGS